MSTPLRLLGAFALMVAALAIGAAPSGAQSDDAPVLTAPQNQTGAEMGEILLVEGTGCEPGAGVIVLLGVIPLGFDTVDDDATFSVPVVVPVVDISQLPDAEAPVLAICEGSDSSNLGALVVLTPSDQPRVVTTSVATSDGGLLLVEASGRTLGLDATEATLSGPGPIVAADSGDGSELWGVTPAGRVSAAGGAALYGDLVGTPLNAPVLGMAATPGGNGYWLGAADGGVFAFGDAGFLGSMGGRFLIAPVVGMAPTPSGEGYWLVAADGGVFAFGDAGFFGSMGGQFPWQCPGARHGPDGQRVTGTGWWRPTAGCSRSVTLAFLGSTGRADRAARTDRRPSPPISDGLGYWLTSAATAPPSPSPTSSR